ncbi:MAG: PHP domain-containing protein [Armatimonadota bacterium]|nr:PHP domain-containing protein [Armatimonadota bacterium]MDR7453375.1 PHP domain-containing protein [Armatimonadota bacterium]MDR7457194.1 PHP domain-containing protein [Armatimonadota bacterium]MDR7496066.1 PHP domain-containing protein [Armatimonadota bacterium]MDR7511959.1 PHP domain-containing protein [Armatimonadota bacterium]
MRIDLHTHTTASDGVLAPAALVEEARRWGVEVLAVSDHDTTAGLDEALGAGAALGVEVWPAVELSCDVEAGEVHMLGYFVDRTLDWFQALLSRLRDGRSLRARRMVERLAALGVPVEFDRVRQIAGEAAIGRPHVARALVEAGRVRTVAEAFDRFIGRHGPAYVERVKVTPLQAVDVIRAAGGLAVLAHPGWGGQEGMVPALVAGGLDGIEVYHPDHTPDQVRAYAALAGRYGLLVTGGTDFHGGGLATRVNVGSQYVPEHVLPPLRAAAARRRPGAPPVLDLAVE